MHYEIDVPTNSVPSVALRRVMRPMSRVSFIRLFLLLAF